ncbi:hypothetical protein EI94DRAFT_1701468 [Lactarius quietus]|nr:hypothetical protein EI94DRAFT_1701468 [Lactarius quietus]
MSDAEDFDLGADGGESDSSSHYDPQEMPILSNVQLDASELVRYKALQTKYNASKSTKSAPAKKGRRSMLSGEDKEITLAEGGSLSRLNFGLMTQSSSEALADPRRRTSFKKIFLQQARGKYPRWPAMLFPNRDCENTNAFAVEELPKTILHGVSSLGGDPAGRRAPRASLWGITKTMPGMIALAATILTFVCGPDQVFSEKSKGPSNVGWRDRFWDYKQAILRFPPQYISFLLSWYDHRIFPAKSGASTSANSTLTSQQGPNDIDDLIRCMTVNIDVGQSLCAPAIPQVQLTRSPLTAVEAELTPLAQANAHPSEQHKEAVNTPTDTAATKRVSKGARAVSVGSRKTRSGNSKAQAS